MTPEKFAEIEASHNRNCFNYIHCRYHLQEISLKFSSAKFHGNPFNSSSAFSCVQAEGQTDERKEQFKQELRGIAKRFKNFSLLKKQCLGWFLEGKYAVVYIHMYIQTYGCVLLNCENVLTMVHNTWNCCFVWILSTLRCFMKTAENTTFLKLQLCPCLGDGGQIYSVGSVRVT